MVKQLDYEVARHEADSDVHVRYARRVAPTWPRPTYEKFKEANKTQPRHGHRHRSHAAPSTEWDKAKLTIEKAE